MIYFFKLGSDYHIHGIQYNITFKHYFFGRWEGRSQMNVTVSMQSSNYSYTRSLSFIRGNVCWNHQPHASYKRSGLVDIDPEKASIAFRSLFGPGLVWLT
jgi:hypothetical protein